MDTDSVVDPGAWYSNHAVTRSQLTFRALVRHMSLHFATSCTTFTVVFSSIYYGAKFSAFLNVTSPMAVVGAPCLGGRCSGSIPIDDGSWFRFGGSWSI